jgi:ABC-2 type transport system ATP-binding protein
MSGTAGRECGIGAQSALYAAGLAQGPVRMEQSQDTQKPSGTPAIAVKGVSKTYASGLEALSGIDLTVRDGEILALLGPNGAGKTTLISIICGIVNASTGTVEVSGHDIYRSFRKARELIGLVPQELHTDAFETVWATTRFSRGLFGKKPDDAYLEQVLRDLSLFDKKDSKIMTLSGGMKRRVMVAKALAHEPRILFLDEPTAGVDVELRKDMWQLIRRLRDSGVTIILTTHYIEEAEDIADRIGVINRGRLLLIEEKAELMRKLGEKQLKIELQHPLPAVPEALSAYGLSLGDEGRSLIYHYDSQAARSGIGTLLADLRKADIPVRDLSTSQRSLEEIFVGLVRESA